MIEPATPDDVAEIVRITNAAYARGEAGIWRPGWTRTTAESTAAEVAAGEVFAARDGGRIAGSIHVVRIGTDTAEFGQLAVAPERQGHGLGRKLIDFAERLHDVAWMELELLIPATPHAHKQRLHEWYVRLGYAPAGRRPFADAYPEPAALLAVPADLVRYRKALR